MRLADWSAGWWLADQLAEREAGRSLADSRTAWWLAHLEAGSKGLFKKSLIHSGNKLFSHSLEDAYLHAIVKAAAFPY